MAEEEKHDLRKKERAVLDEFCRFLWNSFGINNKFRKDWDFIYPVFSEFLHNRNIDLGDLEKFKYRYPLSMVVEGSATHYDDKHWDEYWRWEQSPKDQIKYLREDFCGIGSRLVKSRLNALGKTDQKAKILRMLLELEDHANCESRYFGSYLERAKEKRKESALTLRNFCINSPGLIECGTFGNGMIFFQFLDGGQQFCWKFDSDWANSNFESADLSVKSIKIYEDDQIRRLEKMIISKLNGVKNGGK